MADSKDQSFTKKKTKGKKGIKPGKTGSQGSVVEQVPPRYFNRELSWIEFNKRVLSEAGRGDKPILERLKFLSIVSANLDEFFMVRIASLKRQILAGNYTSCPTHMSPRAQLEACAQQIRVLIDDQYGILLNEVFPQLAEQGLVYRNNAEDLTHEQHNYLLNFFKNQVFPLLTPVRVNLASPSIPGANLRLQVAFLLKARQDAQFLMPSDQEEHLAIVQIPQTLERILFIPDKDGKRSFVLLETLLVQFAPQLFPGYEILEHLIFRVTRDADFGVDESRDEDFVEAMEQVLSQRHKSNAVRLAVGQTSARLQQLLQTSLGLDDIDVYAAPEPLEVATLMHLSNITGYDSLKFEGWPPREPEGLNEDDDLWDVLKQRDVLLHHPFESFQPVIRMVEQAASDPQVMAIKMTLYRTSGNSPIVQALQTAAQNGKQVTVLVELKARFDEQRNISWAERLSQAGVIVIYGISQMKVHAKAMLIIRKEVRGIVRYLHLGTGNYNEKTATLYTDMGLLTTRDDLCYEAGLFFNAITGYSAVPSLAKLFMAPHGLKHRLVQLIHREAEKSIPENPGRIVAKLNSLADVDIINALYRASQKGVKIDLNIRGICMLVPGVPGLSENIRVISIIDRYLEHTRAVMFRNSGNEEVYLSSADWMPRNLERRVELLFPVDDREIASRIIASLELCMDDRVQGYKLNPDGTYTRRQPKKSGNISSQEARYNLSRQLSRTKKAHNEREFQVRRKAPGRRGLETG